MMRSGGSVQKAQGFMPGSLSSLPNTLEAKPQSFLSRNLVGVIHVFPQNCRTETAGRVFPFDKVHPQLVQRFDVKSLETTQGVD